MYVDLSHAIDGEFNTPHLCKRILEEAFVAITPGNVLYCILLYSTALHGILLDVLFCTVSYCTVLYSTVLHRNATRYGLLRLFCSSHTAHH